MKVKKNQVAAPGVCKVMNYGTTKLISRLKFFDKKMWISASIEPAIFGRFNQLNYNNQSAYFSCLIEILFNFSFMFELVLQVPSMDQNRYFEFVFDLHPHTNLTATKML